MPKQKQPRAIETDYNRMHLEILRGTKRHWWGIITIALAIVLAVIFWIFINDKYTLREITGIIFVNSFFIIIVPLLLKLAADNLFATDTENKLVNIALDFLRKENFQPHLLETLDSRAEIGSAAGQFRTLLPILAIPIMIPLLISFQNVRHLAELLLNTNQSLRFFSIIGICVISFSLFRELDRANIDVIVRHAIAQYRCEQEAKKCNQPDQTEISFIEKLIMTNEL